MKRTNVLRAVTVALVVISTRVLAQNAGDAREGLASAQAFCSECHAIRKGEPRSPNAQSPTFVELANSSGITTTALLVALTTPHAGMPMFVLTPQQRTDIIAYVLSLKE